MITREEIVNKTIRLYKMLKTSNEDLSKIGESFKDSNLFKNISNIAENDERLFLNNILDDQDRCFNPLFFLMLTSEFLKTIRGTEILSEIIVNLNLLQFQNNCNHKDNEIIYKQGFSTYFPIYNQKEISFCKSCFIDYYEKKIFNNIPHIEDNDIVGVGVSGEKDSMAALKAICELRKKSKLDNFELIVNFIDEGIRGQDGTIPYRETCEKKVRKICDSYNLPLKIHRYEEIFGFTIDGLYNFGLNPCNYDSQLMGVVSRKFAYENKITKLLTNLTETEAFQFSILALEGLKFNLMPFSPKIISKTKIKDHKFLNYSIMLNLRNEENITYLKCTNTEYNSTIKCPYHHFNIGKLNNPLINQMEIVHPGAITFFNEGLNKLILQGKRNKITRTSFNFCPNCGLPSLSGFGKDCIVCKLRKKLEEKN